MYWDMAARGRDTPVLKTPVPRVFSAKQIHLHQNRGEYREEGRVREKQSDSHLFTQEWGRRPREGTQTLPGTHTSRQTPTLWS